MFLNKKYQKLMLMYQIKNKKFQFLKLNRIIPIKIKKNKSILIRLSPKKYFKRKLMIQQNSKILETHILNPKNIKMPSKLILKDSEF